MILLGMVLAVILSLGYVYATSSSDLSTLDGIIAFLKNYVTWLVAVFGNTGKIAGYAINQDWKPVLNLSNSS